MEFVNLKQFKPTIIFLLKFVGSYFVMNLVYGLYVESFSPTVDNITQWVTNQTSGILDLFGWETGTWNRSDKASTSITYKGDGIVAVYEGCNGMNVSIIFLSFIFAFGPLNKRLSWFAPVGLLVIHGFNLARIIALFFVAIYLPGAVYFSHKYIFTAFIYAVVFGLWLIWLRMNYTSKT